MTAEHSTPEEGLALVRELEAQRDLAFTRCTILARKLALAEAVNNALRDEIAARKAKADQ